MTVELKKEMAERFSLMEKERIQRDSGKEKQTRSLIEKMRKSFALTDRLTETVKKAIIEEREKFLKEYLK